MDLRKIQRTSSGTFFVSLPKRWSELVGLEKGKVIGVLESADGRLVLDPKYNMEREPLKATVKPTSYLDREIVGKYLLGYDEICVLAEDSISPEERALVKKTSTRLVGLEIVEEDYARIVLQCLLEPAASSPEKILRREYNIAAGMHRDAVRAFLENDLNLAENVIARDVEVNRFYFLLVRTLRKALQDPNSGEKLGIGSIDCLDYRLCSNLVENIGDRAVEVACKVSALGNMKVSGRANQLIQRFHRMIFGVQEKAMTAFFEHSVTLAEEVRNSKGEADTIFKDIESTAKKRFGLLVPSMITVASSLYRIFGHCVDIADLVMPREL